MDDDFGLTEEDKMDVIEFFDAYRLSELPEGTTYEDLPVATNCLEVLLADLGFLVTEAELIDLEEKLDPHKKGYITMPVFVEQARDLFARTRVNEENAEAVFQVFDKDNDGLFREGDVKEVLALFGERLPNSFVKSMLGEADMDGDGAVGLDEFKFFICGEVF